MEPKQEEESEAVERAVKLICAVVDAERLAVAYKVGEIVKNLLSPNEAMPSSRKKYKWTYRQLAHHADLPFTRGTLWMYLRIYRCVRANGTLEEFKRAKIKHVKEISDRPAKEQRALLHQSHRGTFVSRYRRQADSARKALLGRDTDKRSERAVKTPAGLVFVSWNQDGKVTAWLDGAQWDERVVLTRGRVKASKEELYQGRKAEARRLLEAGMSMKEISAEMGYSVSTVHAWLTPDTGPDGLSPGSNTGLVGTALGESDYTTTEENT